MSSAPQAATEEVVMKRYFPYLFAGTSMALSMGIALILPYLSFFATDFMGMSLPALAVLLTVTTSADWAMTFISGPICQKTMTKWGQYRPWLIISPLTIYILYSVVFFGIRASDTAMILIIGTCYGISGFAWQTLQISGGALMAKVAGASPANRLKITSTQAIGSRVITFLMGLFTGPFIQWATPRGINPYFIITLIYNGIVCVPYFIMFFVTKDIDVYDPNFKAPTSGSTNFSPIEMYKETFKNRHFLMVFFSAIVTGLGAQAISPLNTFYFRYSLASLGGMNLMAVQSTVSTPVGIAASTFMPPIARRLGKKKSTVFVRYFAVVTGIATALFTDGNFIAKVIIVSISTFSMAVSTAWGNNLYQDVSEFQEYTTGKDMRGFILGMSNMTARLSAVIGTPIAAFVLANSGYDQVNNTFENTFRLCLFIGLAPAIANLLGGIMFHAGYGLTDEKAKEYAEHNQQVKAERAAALAAAAAEAAPSS